MAIEYKTSHATIQGLGKLKQEHGEFEDSIAEDDEGGRR